MMNDRTLELINREIDGLNSPSESSELQSTLSDNPSAKQFYEEQKRIAGILNGVTPVEPPSSIKHNVMREVRAEAVAPRQISKRVVTDVSWLHWTNTVRIAVGMAAGILLMAIFWPSTGSLPVNDWDVSGTLVSRGDRGKTTSQMSLAGVSSSISWYTREKDVIFVITAEGSETATIRMTSDKAGNLVRTVTRDQSSKGEVSFENQSVVIEHDGTNAYTVVMERAGMQSAKVDFALEVAGKTVETSANVVW